MIVTFHDIKPLSLGIKESPLFNRLRTSSQVTNPQYISITI